VRKEESCDTYHHWPDFYIIVVLLVANAAVGFWEEYQAGNAIAALKAKLVLQARVQRDGTWATMAARELVPGDLIRLRLEDIVPVAYDPVESGVQLLPGDVGQSRQAHNLTIWAIRAVEWAATVAQPLCNSSSGTTMPERWRAIYASPLYA